MLEKLAAIEAKYSQIEARLAAPETYDDPAAVARLNKEQNELSPVVETYRSYLAARERLAQAEELLSDPEMRELAQEELLQTNAELERLEGQLQLLLLPKDPNDNKNVIVEIRAPMLEVPMLEKLAAIEAKYSQIEARLAAPETYDDPAAVARLNKEQNELSPVVETYRSYLAARERLAQAEELLSDPEMRELAQEELLQTNAELERLEGQLQLLLLPKDPNDNKNVIVEIRAGVGGEEAALFAHSLYRMYSMYAERSRWKTEVDSLSETELGGIKEISFTIEGEGAWSRLKFESGVHRVQRVPETESGGRVHTSTATVAVLPEMETVDVQLNPADVEMQVFRASGAGGQHVNKTSSAVRLIHRPTGMVVECQQERSQFQNRDKAMRLLASRLYEAEQEKVEGAYTAQRRSQVGTGMRNERIRTYNFPQGRVTDHRIGLTLYKIDTIMDGDLNEVINALVTADQAERLRSQGTD